MITSSSLVSNQYNSESSDLFKPPLSSNELTSLQEKLRVVASCHDDTRTLCSADVIRTATSPRRCNEKNGNYRSSIKKAMEWEEQLRQIRKAIYDLDNIGKLLPFYSAARAVSRAVAVLHLRQLIIPASIARSALRSAMCPDGEQAPPVFYLSVYSDNGTLVICKQVCGGSDAASRGTFQMKYLTQCNRDSWFVLPLNLRMAIPIQSERIRGRQGTGRARFSIEWSFLNRSYVNLDYEAEAKVIGKGSVRSFCRYDQFVQSGGRTLPPQTLQAVPEQVLLEGGDCSKKKIQFQEILLHEVESGSQIKMLGRVSEILINVGAVGPSLPTTSPFTVKLRDFFNGSRTSPQNPAGSSSLSRPLDSTAGTAVQLSEPISQKPAARECTLLNNFFRRYHCVRFYHPSKKSWVRLKLSHGYLSALPADRIFFHATQSVLSPQVALLRGTC